MADIKDRIIYFQLGFILGIFMTVFMAGAGYMAIKSLGGSGVGSAAKIARKIKSIGMSQGKLTDFNLNFEKKSDIRFFKKEGNIQLDQSQENVTEGSNSLFVKVPEGHGGYPGLIWEAYNAKECLNWKEKREFLFDVTNTGPKSTYLVLKMKSGVSGSKKKFEKWIHLPVNETIQASIPIDAIKENIDITRISYLKFFFDKPKSELNIFIDNMRVEG